MLLLGFQSFHFTKVDVDCCGLVQVSSFYIGRVGFWNVFWRDLSLSSQLFELIWGFKENVTKILNHKLLGSKKCKKCQFKFFSWIWRNVAIRWLKWSPKIMNAIILINFGKTDGTNLLNSRYIVPHLYTGDSKLQSLACLVIYSF